ncbi:MAG TPA: hypothetical protein VG733_07010 [Chthoniobacteraceae bacterium]|nr:hypothetical protein [Chthoniobacteraceae bacterium]
MKKPLLNAILLVLLWAANCMAQQTDPSQSKPDAGSVPAAAGKSSEDKTAQHVTVELKDGSLLEGELPGDFSFPVQAPGMKAEVAIKSVASITFSDDHATAVVNMQNGDRISGTPGIKSVPLKMVIGAVPVEALYIKSISILSPGITSLREEFEQQLYGVKWTWNGAWKFTFEKDGTHPGIGFAEWRIVKPYVIEYSFADGNHGTIVFKQNMQRAAINEINPQGEKNPITLYRVEDEN